MMRMRRLTRNWGWKVASLALSAAFWVALSVSRESTTSISAPVQYRNIPKSLEISSDMVEQVHLILRGPSVKLARISPADHPVVIDFSKVNGPGENTFTISRLSVSLPAGVYLERAVPSQVRLHLEAREAKPVPVQIRFSHLPSGMMVTKQEAFPDHLTVIGPESHISRIVAVETDPVDLRTLSANGEALTTAYAGDSQVNFTTAPQVRVRISMGPVPAPKPPEPPASSQKQ